MRFLKTTTLLCLLSFTTVMAQKDTTFYNTKGQKVENRASAYYYTVITTKSLIEIHEAFYLSGGKKSYRMYKKVPLVMSETVAQEQKSKKNKKPISTKPDSTVVNHGSFTEWYETGDTKIRGANFAGKLHGDLETFSQIKNSKGKRRIISIPLK